jgi:hypothetical protein
MAKPACVLAPNSAPSEAKIAFSAVHRLAAYYSLRGVRQHKTCHLIVMINLGGSIMMSTSVISTHL